MYRSIAVVDQPIINSLSSPLLSLIFSSYSLLIHVLFIHTIVIYPILQLQMVLVYSQIAGGEGGHWTSSYHCRAQICKENGIRTSFPRHSLPLIRGRIWEKGCYAFRSPSFIRTSSIRFADETTIWKGNGEVRSYWT